MSKRRTAATDIRNPERYFSKWLSCEKKNFHRKQNEIYGNEESLEYIAETKSGDGIFAVNLHGELFAEAEAENSEFAWMELFTNQKLYDVVSQLTKFEIKLLTLRFQQKYSFKEIGEELGISSNAANVSYFRLIEKIKNNF